MLRVSNVTKKYGQIIANHNVTFEVGDGNLAVLIGPNGAGKSTIIKCIAGLLRFEGEILIGEYQNKSIEAKKRLGYIPEIPAVYDLLTVGEHLEFIKRAYKLRDSDQYAEELLERFELSDKKSKLGKELSKGMQQKLSISCALLPKPKVIVFDEPMVGLDPHAIKQLKKMFSELTQNGASVFISTHMLDSVEDYWDKAYIMNNGKIAAGIDNTSSQDSASLEDLYFSIIEPKNDGEAES